MRSSLVIGFLGILGFFNSLPFVGQCWPVLPSGDPLYTEGDLVTIASSTNFSQIVFNANSQKSHFVQFFNRWCGHCTHFAPTFKSLAKDINEWQKLVVELVVVDCADDSNTKLCRSMNVMSYPSVKMFWYNAKEGVDRGDDGEEGIAALSIKAIRASIIDWLMNNWSKGAPRSWPDLGAVSALTVDQLHKMLPVGRGKSVVLVIEKSDSYVGREIILDLSPHQDELILLRMTTHNEKVLNEYLSQNLNQYSLPILVEVKDDYSPHVLLMANEIDEDMQRAKFVNYLKNKFIKHKEINGKTGNNANENQNINKSIMNKLHNKGQETKQEQVIDVPVNDNVKSNNNEAVKSDSAVNIIDLNNAIRYAIYREVALKPKLNSTQINALKDWLRVIDKHFPFHGHERTSQSQLSAHEFIKSLIHWLDQHDGHQLDMEDFLSEMKNIEQRNGGRGLPEMKPWKACSSSIGGDRFRGYPCSVWTLFHTLTVSEYLKTLVNPRWSNLHAVLYAMRGYITNFFSCTNCARHFGEMSKDLESVLTLPNSSVLWLWRAHNKVNQRLHGSETEDPGFPKIQFPSEIDCGLCHKRQSGSIDEISWNEEAVLQFLIKQYREQSIVYDNDDFSGGGVGVFDEEPAPGNVVEVKKVDVKLPEVISSLNHNKDPMRDKWTYVNYMSATDYSLCLALYLMTTILIISVCVYFVRNFRRRRRKYTNNYKV